MGWDALPIGTACGHLAGGLIPLVMLLRGRAGLRIQRSMLRPDIALMRRILRIGVPGGIDVLSIVVCQLIFLSIVDRLGTVAAAAHGVAIRIESLAYLPGYAFQVAAATLAGQYLGARDYRQANRSVLVACASSGSLLFVSAPGAVLWRRIAGGIVLGARPGRRGRGRAGAIAHHRRSPFPPWRCCKC